MNKSFEITVVVKILNCNLKDLYFRTSVCQGIIDIKKKQEEQADGIAFLKPIW